ncbi:hypothetical protein PGB90_009508 [Kerria lacca]
MPNNNPITVDQLKSILDQFFNEKFGFLENILLKNKQLKEKIQILEERMDSIESYSRRNNIIVHGVPRQENENPLELALEICKTTGTEIESYEIDEAHRMPSRNREISPPFIIKLTNRFKKAEIMKNYKKKKITAEIWKGNSNNRIFFNDHLTKKKQEIFKKAKILWDNYLIWTREGTK